MITVKYLQDLTGLDTLYLKEFCDYFLEFVTTGTVWYQYPNDLKALDFQPDESPRWETISELYDHDFTHETVVNLLNETLIKWRLRSG